MSPQRWQSWMALLPCERCGWMPDGGCTCRAGVPRSAPPPTPRKGREKQLRVLTLEERRAAYASLSAPVLEVIAAAAAEKTQGRGAA